LSSIGTVEFHSHSSKVGMKIIMTDDGFAMEPINNVDALSHPGVKVVIKKAKKKLISETALMEYLSKTFAIRIARGAKIFLNNNLIPKPEGFDANEYPLFQMHDGAWIKGNLKVKEKPEINNIGIFVKNVLVDSKVFEFKVAGWLNCNKLIPISSRDGIHEEGADYEKFINGLIEYLKENYERKSQSKNENVKSEKQLTKLFASIIGSIRDIYPHMNKPLMTGNPSGETGIGSLSYLKGDAHDPCSEQKGMMIDNTKTAEPTIGKPIGEGKAHKRGTGESNCRITKGDGRALTPSHIKNLFSGNEIIPEPKLAVVEREDQFVVRFSAPNTLVINKSRPSADILINANPRDPEMKSRVLPLLVIAGIDAFPGASEMSREEWFRVYNVILDTKWANR
jgi:hypothetical protein